MWLQQKSTLPREQLNTRKEKVTWPIGWFWGDKSCLRQRRDKSRSNCVNEPLSQATLSFLHSFTHIIQDLFLPWGRGSLFPGRPGCHAHISQSFFFSLSFDRHKGKAICLRLNKTVVVHFLHNSVQNSCLICINCFIYVHTAPTVQRKLPRFH